MEVGGAHPVYRGHALCTLGIRRYRDDRREGTNRFHSDSLFARGAPGGAARGYLVTDLEALREAEPLELADVDLERGGLAADARGELRGRDPGMALDQPERLARPGLGGGRVHALEPPRDLRDVLLAEI